MKLALIGVAVALAAATPALAQMAPNGAPGQSSPGRGDMQRRPIDRDSMERGSTDRADMPPGDAMNNRGVDHGAMPAHRMMAKHRTHCRTVWRHNHRVRTCR